MLLVRMGCVRSSQKVHAANNFNIGPYYGQCSQKNGKETIVAALVRLDKEIIKCEKTYPAERLAVVTVELISIQEEMNMLGETATSLKMINAEEYGRTLHQVFVSLDIYRRSMVALENEDFVANVNRKEMQKIELIFLRTRFEELQNEKKVLLGQIRRIQSLYESLQKLLDSIWSENFKLATSLESSLKRARAIRDALASVSARLKAAAEYAQDAVKSMDDALPVWKFISVGKNGWDRTLACADASRLLVQARCSERAARRVLAAYAAPRASRALRLSLDYAFTDVFHDQKYRQATETFTDFKEALQLLITCIHQVLLNNLDNLAVAERDVEKARSDLRTARVNAIVKKGLADLTYDSKLLSSLHQ